MTRTKGYEKKKRPEQLGRMKCERFEITGCTSGLMEIYKDLFFSDESQEYPKKWIFRGEKRSKKGQLECRKCKRRSVCQSEDGSVVFRTSLERAFRAYEVNGADDRKKSEASLNRSFKRRVHHYTNDAPEDGDILEWLALTRHYFGPTRLLDCTYSFFIACYMAINQLDYKKEQAEIWAIDADWLSYKKEGAEKIERVADIIGRVEYASFEKKAQELANAAYADKNRAFHNEIIHGLMRERRQCVCNVTPFRLNERVLAQKGTFLLQGDTSKCFVRNLESTITQGNARADGALKRIVVKFSKIREFWINLASSSADKPKHLWQESD